ncbi:hypothetical protein APE_2574 [Aeropyrum pernix K1]|uniref:Uncharacterized protein n=1 Tax=Aeropyrum pernix (strain ATCC 700893 / DSM 11879 / JCM 9820 / NBRC 100138 / K1) TaxID=272557 RepID=Q9Y8Q9_AERPE|nr:hypothetical protein [Aeropyrum pernix]BAA81591.1 hypothetical protein APE_2574 [Aeropyrum pernix K1]
MPSKRDALFTALSSLSISTMTNAPSLASGYGLTFAVEYYAVMAYRPRDAALYILAAHTLALPLLVLSKAVFPVVALVSLLLRPIGVYAAGVLSRGGGPATAAVVLAGVEQLLALTVAVLYYGDDGIHASLAIYGVFTAPFAYTAFKSASRGDSAGAFLAGSALILYWLATYSLLSVPALVASVAVVALLYLHDKILIGKAYSRAIPLLGVFLLAAGVLLGGSALLFNSKAALNPFNPTNYTDGRWAQLEPGECPPAENVFAETHTPERLRIVDTCLTVEGRVSNIPSFAGDGDYVFDIDPKERWLLGLGNILLRKGGLHIEVVPGDYFEVLGLLGGGVCPGDLLRVTGVYVFDTDHGMWAEIHPALSIEILERATTVGWPECVQGVEAPG